MKKMNKEKLKEFLGEKVKYDPAGQMIFGGNKKTGDNLILDVRGWGTIQYMFKDPRDAQKFQDDFGQFVVDAINEKLITN